MAKAAGNGYSPSPKAAAPRFYSTLYFFRIIDFGQLCGEGFLVTAYPTDAIKEGEYIWPK